MHDDPAAPELLEAVAELLRAAIVPGLEGALAYQARIAGSLIGLVARELRAGPIEPEWERDSLRALLGEDGEPQVLRAKLAERIAARTLSIDDPSVAAHLRRVALAKLGVDQPDLARSIGALDRS